MKTTRLLRGIGPLSVVTYGDGWSSVSLSLGARFVGAVLVVMPRIHMAPLDQDDRDVGGLDHRAVGEQALKANGGPFVPTSEPPPNRGKLPHTLPACTPARSMEPMRVVAYCKRRFCTTLALTRIPWRRVHFAPDVYIFADPNNTVTLPSQRHRSSSSFVADEQCDLKGTCPSAWRMETVALSPGTSPYRGRRVALVDYGMIFPQPIDSCSVCQPRNPWRPLTSDGSKYRQWYYQVPGPQDFVVCSRARSRGTVGVSHDRSGRTTRDFSWPPLTKHAGPEPTPPVTKKRA